MKEQAVDKEIAGLGFWPLFNLTYPHGEIRP